ncbi:MAG: rhodanese-like domain-containing protein [Planctomycetota bacterium]|nr:MAG: rhodanese-like domain-containing protein [Planctomycetota bacterium]
MHGALQLSLLFFLALLGGGAFLGYHASQRTATWERLDRVIAERFPELPEIDVASLDQWLADPAREPPGILDARSPEEFAISRLPGAQWVGSDRESAQRVSSHELPPEVIVYSAADPRSAIIVRDLRAAGIDARMLRHGIFAWANADLPLENDAGAASGVHRGNTAMQRLLREDLRIRPDSR